MIGTPNFSIVNQEGIERELLSLNPKMGKEEQPCMLNLILSVDGSKWGRENRELTTLRDIDGQKGNAS